MTKGTVIQALKRYGIPYEVKKVVVDTVSGGKCGIRCAIITKEMIDELINRVEATTHTKHGHEIGFRRGNMIKDLKKFKKGLK